MYLIKIFYFIVLLAWFLILAAIAGTTGGEVLKGVFSVLSWFVIIVLVVGVGSIIAHQSFSNEEDSTDPREPKIGHLEFTNWIVRCKEPSDEEVRALRARIPVRAVEGWIAAIPIHPRSYSASLAGFRHNSKTPEVWIQKWMNVNPPSDRVGRAGANRLIRTLGKDVVGDILRLARTGIFNEISWKRWSGYLDLGLEERPVIRYPATLEDEPCMRLYTLFEEIRCGQDQAEKEFDLQSIEAILQGSSSIESIGIAKQIPSLVAKINRTCPIECKVDIRKNGVKITHYILKCKKK